MFVFKRRNILIVSALILTAITFIVCLSALKSVSAGNSKVNEITVVLDAGHGGIDNGVSGINSGAKESELNLAIVKSVKNLLDDAGFKVVLTRSTDAGLYGVASSSLKQKDMLKRREIILSAKPNLVVSVHLNKFSVSTRRGAQVFYKKGDENSKILAQSIQKEFNALKESTREFSALTGDYYILNCSPYPSIIAECGFLSNPEEEALLLTEEYRNDLAYSIFKGIVSYLAT